MRIGIDIGGSHIGVGIVKGSKLICKKEIVLTKEDKKNIEENIVKNTIELLNQVIEETNIKLDNIEFIGIASPGTISNNKIIQATNLGIENYDLISQLQKYINLPMQIKNDSKCAALAEKNFGAMKEYEDGLFLTIGTGIGGAAFIGGEILEPKRFSGFEFGHMVISKNGRKCSCGKRGCFEQYASIKALKRNIANVLDIPMDFSGKELREKILDFNNEKITKVVTEYVSNLSIGICNLIDIFEPEIVVLGGSFSYYEDNPIYKMLIDKINEKNSRFNSFEKTKIKVAKLKNDAGIIGSTIRV